MVDLEHQLNKYRIDDRRGRPILHEPNGVVREPSPAELWMWAEVVERDGGFAVRRCVMQQWFDPPGIYETYEEALWQARQVGVVLEERGEPQRASEDE